MRHLPLLLASSLVAAAIVIACSYGNYDGSFVGDGGAGGDGGEAGVVVLTKTIQPMTRDELRVPDGALVVVFAAGTFDGPTTVTITRLADRVLTENSLIVPAYTISATKEPLIPFQVALTGNNGNPGQNVLVVARVGADAQLAPTPLVGISPTGPSGNTATFWGIARTFGTFSLIYRTMDNAFFDVASSSCLAKCCNGTGITSNGNVGAIGGSCFCSSSPALECLVENCQSNIAGAIERCVENATTGLPTPICKASSCTNGCNFPNSNCAGNQTCCINQRTGQCTGLMGGQPPPTCNGIAIRCDLGTKCAEGTKCCVFETEAYCASSCPNERTWCNSPTDCADGGACTPAPSCPHGTCGTPPAACTN